MPELADSEGASQGPRLATTERRNRALDAFIDLVLEGHVPPSSEQLADRAGISTATLFRYFETLDQLRGEAAARMVRRFPHLFRIPDIGVGTREQRIERFVANRVELWETIHPLAMLIRSNMMRQPGAAGLVSFARTSTANQVRRHFDSELSALTPAVRDDAVASIATLTSAESWDHFRHAYERSPRKIRRAWTRAIDQVLGGGKDD